MARISVLLPEPDSPPSSTRSPGLTLMSVSSITTRPSRCTIDRSVISMSAWLVFSTTMAAVRAVSSSISSSASCSSCDPPRRRRPFGQADEVLGKPVERRQHGDERRRDLHDGAQRQLAREILGRRQQHRKHRREEGVAVEDPGQVAVLAHDVEPARRHVGEGFVEPLALVVGALDQRDALGVLAHARQLVAELRLALVLGGHAVDERTADQVGEDRGGGGVQHRGNGDVAGNPYARAADRRSSASRRPRTGCRRT